jgi:tetratricopeptide (TPR) repeat protein
MKYLLIVFLATSLLAQHHHEPPAAKASAVLWEGSGNVRHPVSTKNAEAQKFFDQGIALVYGFNHAEAVRSFARAAELDSALGMAHWGVALALGPNINQAMDPDAHAKAWAAVVTAQKLARQASERERDYIAAIAVRYTSNPKADVAPLQKKYAEAMRALAKKYPDDQDAQTLFAESLMNLYPWKLWSADGKPSPVTEEAVAALESVLTREPNHLGANHYLIHCLEASPWPQRALPAAHRLGTLAPALGHLVHMPAHIFMRTGDYEAAARANIDAAAADKKYFESGGVEGSYRGYWAHNLHFLSAAYSMQGRYADSLKAAEETSRVLGPLLEIEALQSMGSAAVLVPVRFRDWKKVLAMPQPPESQGALRNLWIFARAMALACTGDVNGAVLEREKFRAAVAAVSDERTYGNNKEKQVMRLPMFLLDAKIAEVRGDLPQALGHLREAVTAEDSLGYNEPPDWYYPPGREALGALLLKMGRPEDAEVVFREDLSRNQRNGRSLWGLAESLKAQNKKDTAMLIEPQAQAAWARADRPLRLSDLF